MAAMTRPGRVTLLALAGAVAVLGVAALAIVGPTFDAASGESTAATVGHAPDNGSEAAPELTDDSTDGGAGADTAAFDPSGIRSLPPAAGLPEPDAPVAPIELRVPSLGVESGRITAVGVEADGALEVPPASVVGWYRFGAAPGEPGSAVLAGHIAFDGHDGVFRHLASLEAGAAVDVVLEDGSLVAYRVDRVVEYEKSELPTAELFAESGPEQLVLITCGGDFNPSLRSYESNVVAIAVRA